MIRTVRGVGVILMVLASQAYGQSWKNNPSDPDAWYDTIKTDGSGNIAASQVFCGQARKYAPNVAYPAWMGSPNTDAAEIGNVNGSPICLPNYAVGEKRPAIEHVEIRGWLQHPPEKAGDYFTGEEEYFLYLVPDVGWTPSPNAVAAGVYALNTLSRVNDYMPPYNIIQFGGRVIPNTGAGVWGGLNTALIHVEANGWGGRDHLPTSSLPDPSFTRIPSGWDRYVTNKDGITMYWPFAVPGWDLSNVPALVAQFYVGTGSGLNYSAGDYVRIVGTLWEDNWHSSYNNIDWPSTYQNPLDAKMCWNNTTDHDQRGWFEIHPVDWLQKISPPREPHPIAGYALCNNSSGAPGVAETLTFPQPHPRSQIASVVETIDPRYTDWNGVPIQYQGDVSHRAAIVPPNQLTVSLGVQAVPIQAGVFKALYDVIWTCTGDCTNKCGGDDGCGNACATSCATGQTCLASGSCCTPNCADRCAPGPDGCGGTCASAGDPACSGDPCSYCGTAGFCRSVQTKYCSP